MSDALLIFVREPKPGRTKTRLARAIGDEQAAAVYVRMAEHIVRAATAVKRSGLEIYVLVEPPEAVKPVAAWLGGACSATSGGGARLRFEGQAPGDLGDRLRAAFEQRFAAGAERVIAIGTDCPDVGAEAIDAAFSALAGAHAVLGPATDGGYYLIGLSRPLEVFEGIPWSTSDVARVTIERLEDAGASVVQLEVLSDIDEVDDLRAALPRWRELFEGVERGGVNSARATPPEA